MQAPHRPVKGQTPICVVLVQLVEDSALSAHDQKRRHHDVENGNKRENNP